MTGRQQRVDRKAAGLPPLKAGGKRSAAASVVRAQKHLNSKIEVLRDEPISTRAAPAAVATAVAAHAALVAASIGSAGAAHLGHPEVRRCPEEAIQLGWQHVWLRGLVRRQAAYCHLFEALAANSNGMSLTWAVSHWPPNV